MSFGNGLPTEVWLICGVVMHFQVYNFRGIFGGGSLHNIMGRGVVSFGGFGWKGVGLSLEMTPVYMGYAVKIISTKFSRKEARPVRSKRCARK